MTSKDRDKVITDCIHELTDEDDDGDIRLAGRILGWTAFCLFFAFAGYCAFWLGIIGAMQP